MLAAAPYAVRPVPVARPVFLAVSAVVRRAADRAGVPLAVLVGARRHRPVARARWAVMIVLHEGEMSTPQIGRTLGGRDHSTVLHGLREGAALMTTDSDFAQAVRGLRDVWTAARSG